MANNKILISQKRYYMSLRDSGKKQRESAYCSGISERTARRIDKNGITQKVIHNWRTRVDPLEGVWGKLESLLKEAPDLQPSTLLYYLQDEYPGKYDNSVLPSDLELQVGRVDFYNLPLFAESEEELLKKYLNKNIAFRTKQFVPERRALLENNFGSFAEGFGQSGLRTFPTMFGDDNTEKKEEETPTNYLDILSTPRDEDKDDKPQPATIIEY